MTWGFARSVSFWASATFAVLARDENMTCCRREKTAAGSGGATGSGWSLGQTADEIRWGGGGGDAATEGDAAGECPPRL